MLTIGVASVVALAATWAVAMRCPPSRLVRGAAVAVGLVQVATVHLLIGSWILPVAAAAVGAIGGLLSARRSDTPSRWAPLLVAGALVASTLAVGWSGANDASAAWFGSVVTHGDRSRPMVALTFDDGPNDSATLAVARILEERGARGTFFVVGQAVRDRPDLVRALVAGGHVVGAHSFRHGDHDWLDPGYPEAARGSQAIADVVGRCPAFFRPPRGLHSPWMARATHRLGEEMVTWDVLADDWLTDDARLIAARVLEKARPGSIILLHDGSDGDPTVDRTVMVRALPLILDGLEERGLRPVGLDELLGRSPWVPCPPS